MGMRKGDNIGQRIRNSILDLHLTIKKENKNKTRQELEENEKFEDVPTRLSNRDKDIGRVKRISTSTIQDRNRE